MDALLASDYWGTPLTSSASHKSFRPITTLTFRLNDMVHGPDLRGYLAVNVALHALVSLVVVRVLAALGLGSRGVLPMLLAATLFAVHPIHTDAVDNAAGRAELLCALFFLLGVLAYIRSVRACSAVASVGFLGAAVACQALALFSKEHGILLGPLCAVLELATGALRDTAARPHGSLQAGAQPQLRLALVGLATAGLAAFRLSLNGGAAPHFRVQDITVAEDSPLQTRILSYAYFASVHASLLLWPANLSHDWSRSSVLPVTDLADARNLKTLSLLGILVLLAAYGLGLRLPGTGPATRYTRHRRDVLVGLVFLVVPFLLSANIFVRVGFTISERALYLPSLGFCMLASVWVAALLRALCARLARVPGQVVCGVCVACIVALCAQHTIARNADWRSEDALALSALRHLPNNAKVCVCVFVCVSE